MEAERDQEGDDKSTVILAGFKCENKKDSGPSAPSSANQSLEEKFPKHEAVRVKTKKISSKNNTESITPEYRSLDPHVVQHFGKNGSQIKGQVKIESPVVNSKFKKGIHHELEAHTHKDIRGKTGKIGKIDKEELNKLQ